MLYYVIPLEKLLPIFRNIGNNYQISLKIYDRFELIFVVAEKLLA